MSKIPLDAYLEELKNSLEILRAATSSIKSEGKRAVWLERLNRSLANVIFSAAKDGSRHLDGHVFRELYSLRSKPLSPHGNGETDRARMTELGRLGGGAKTRRKRAASKQNGHKGGRPSPDKKTIETARHLLSELQKRNPLAWNTVVNYAISPRHLRCLALIMKDRGVSNSDLGLPPKWDPSFESKDPHKRIADFARRRGDWYASHPPRVCPW